MADVDESHSAAFKYGMKMAASEYGVDVVMISKENLNNMSDEIDVIKQEITKKLMRRFQADSRKNDRRKKP